MNSAKLAASYASVRHSLVVLPNISITIAKYFFRLQSGGFLAQLTCMGGLPGLFALSAVLRLVALLPLVFVREHRSVRLSELMREMTLGIGALLLRSRKNIVFLPSRPQPVPIQAVELGDSVKIGSRE